jgi:hypothetical protein
MTKDVIGRTKQRSAAQHPAGAEASADRLHLRHFHGDGFSGHGGRLLSARGVSVLPWPFLAVEAEAMADLAPLAFSDAILGADLCFRLGKALELSSNRIFIPLSLRYAYGFRDNGHSIGLGLAVMDLQDSFGRGTKVCAPSSSRRGHVQPEQAGFWWSYSLVRIWVYF